MNIVYREKENRSDFIRNLKPTDVCYINNQLYMVVMPSDKYYNSMVVNLETGKVKYFNCHIIVQLASCIIAVNV